MTEHLTTCPLCEVTRGLLVEVADGDVVSVRGDADHPPSSVQGSAADLRSRFWAPQVRP